jgi:serine/threonine protein kinase
MLLAQKYRLTRKIAEGGFGDVYEAVHIHLPHHPKRAIKFIKPEVFEKPGIAHRFYREVRVTSMLSQRCQHIVQIFDDFGDIPNLGHFFVMEYLEGETLSERYKSFQGGTTLEEVAPIFYQLCNAIQHAHDEGVIHRDLKPDNILLLDQPGESTRVKVIDFGIAKPLAWDTQSITQGAIGTPLYMSPEQCLGQKVTAATDIYALGALLYECLTGITPFGPISEEDAHHFTPIQIIHGHVSTDLPQLEQSAPQHAPFPPGLQAALEQAMHKSPDKRFASARDFEQAIRDILDNRTRMTPTALPTGQATIAETGGPLAPDTVLHIQVPQQHTFMEPIAGASTLLLGHDDGKATTPQAAMSFEPTPPTHSKGTIWLMGGGIGLALLGIGLFLGIYLTKPGQPAPRPVAKKRHIKPRPATTNKKQQAFVRLLRECPKTRLHWSYLLIPKKQRNILSLRFVDGHGTVVRKPKGICVGLPNKQTKLMIEGKGIIPCRFIPWKEGKRIPLFLQMEDSGPEPGTANYCLSQPG